MPRARSFLAARAGLCWCDRKRENERPARLSAVLHVGCLEGGAVLMPMLLLWLISSAGVPPHSGRDQQPSREAADDCGTPIIVGTAVGGVVVAGSGVAVTFALAELAQSEGRSFAGSSAPRLGAVFAAPVVAVIGGLVGGGAGALAGLGVCSLDES